MEKTYNPSSFEKKIYKNWEEKGISERKSIPKNFPSPS